MPILSLSLSCSCSFPIDIRFNGKGNGICVPNELKCFVHIYPEILLSVIFSVKLKHFTHTHTVAQRHSQNDIYALTYASSHTRAYGERRMRKVYNNSSSKKLPAGQNKFLKMYDDDTAATTLPLLWLWLFCYRVSSFHWLTIALDCCWNAFVYVFVWVQYFGCIRLTLQLHVTEWVFGISRAAIVAVVAILSSEIWL